MHVDLLPLMNGSRQMPLAFTSVVKQLATHSE